MGNMVAAIEFKYTPDGFKYESAEAFVADMLKQVEFIMKERHDKFLDQAGGDVDKLPPLPMFVNILFEDGSAGQTMLWPESAHEKKHLMRGVKMMMQKYDKKKKITDAVMIMEAWMSQIDTKKRDKENPLHKELSEEQKMARIQREYRENKFEKVTKMILEHQTPVQDASGKQSTYVTTQVFDMFENRILILDEKLTNAMNSHNKEKTTVVGHILTEEGVSNNHRVNHFALFNPPTPEELQEYKDLRQEVTNYNLETAVAYLRRLNTYLK